MPKIETNLIGAPPRYPGKLLKTGQTTQYSGELDDGHYEVGRTKRYLILTTGQHSGACVFTLDGKTETQSHNVVRDLETGLMWARYSSAESASVGAGADGMCAWSGTDDDIFQYCAAANVAKLGGYEDWRVANTFELVGLMDLEATDAAPDSTAFPGWETGTFMWSSTVRPSLTTRAQRVWFLHGHVDNATFATVYPVALVRGGV